MAHAAPNAWFATATQVPGYSREAVMKARPPPKTSASDSQLRRVGLPAAGKKDARASVHARAAHSGQGGPFFPYLKNTKQSALLSPPRSATQPSPGVVPIASVVLVQRGGEALAAGSKPTGMPRHGPLCFQLPYFGDFFCTGCQKTSILRGKVIRASPRPQ